MQVYATKVILIYTQEYIPLINLFCKLFCNIILVSYSVKEKDKMRERGVETDTLSLADYTPQEGCIMGRPKCCGNNINTQRRNQLSKYGLGY